MKAEYSITFMLLPLVKASHMVKKAEKSLHLKGCGKGVGMNEL